MVYPIGQLPVSWDFVASFLILVSSISTAVLNVWLLNKVICFINLLYVTTHMYLSPSGTGCTKIPKTVMADCLEFGYHCWQVFFCGRGTVKSNVKHTGNWISLILGAKPVTDLRITVSQTLFPVGLKLFRDVHF